MLHAGTHDQGWTGWDARYIDILKIPDIYSAFNCLDLVLSLLVRISELSYVPYLIWIDFVLVSNLKA